ncbi:precorrin-4 C(11)-methyltransferase [Aestuariispira ectoiniformans]|uniref:precorrin-4 C(11)-methyltransferase n=1 Tax=Aestuariispira ectoiniformans TaxID=2775080 RepID=UPI00223ACFB8|nr:precorrin-4 C(11)-methyltransferase [Aestuariispira ectoiniformans]
MTVYFIGAGPGAPDLITVRGLKLIQQCPVCLFAGSLVPEEVVAEAPDDARVIDTAPMHLDEIIDEIVAAHEAGKDVARVHSGDPCLYGATAEQMRRLDKLGIDYEVVPGVSAYAAAAAAINSELTLAGVSQSIVLTRTAVRASSMPEGETLENFGNTGATLAIHLSVNNLAKVVRELTPHYGEDCPVVVAYRVTWPDQKIIRGTLADIRQKVKPEGITRTALILVGRVLENEEFEDSRLYAKDHTHVLRP